MTATATPPLEPGLTFVEQPDRGAIHRLVLGSEVLRTSNSGSGETASRSDHDGETSAERRRSRDGVAVSRDDENSSAEFSNHSADNRTGVARETLWVDAGGAATTYGLTAQAPDRRALRGIRVARAFTAHQHHQLVRDCIATASGRTGLVVAPNVAALYERADASAAEIDRLFDASIGLLANLADALGVPVLVSAPHAGDERRAAIRERASEEIECRRTDLGYAFATDAFETTGYWKHGWWQTTIPYWVELFGAVGTNPAVDAVEPTATEVAALD